MNADFLKRIRRAVRQGVGDVFEDEIIPNARANSPKESGANADSIAAYVRSRGNKVLATLYTQSGYGGYLERGTSKMAPHPYIFPAAQQGLLTVSEKIAARIIEFSEGNVTEISDEVIGAASRRLLGGLAKGTGVVGGKAARIRRAKQRLRGER